MAAGQRYISATFYLSGIFSDEIMRKVNSPAVTCQRTGNSRADIIKCDNYSLLTSAIFIARTLVERPKRLIKPSAS